MALQTLRQRTVVRTEPSRRASAIVGAAITILACAALLWMQQTGDDWWGDWVSSSTPTEDP